MAADYHYMCFEVRGGGGRVSVKEFQKFTETTTVEDILETKLNVDTTNQGVGLFAFKSLDTVTSGSGIKVDMKMPLRLLYSDFGCRSIVVIPPTETPELELKDEQRSVFDVLMTMSRSYTQLPEKRRENNNKDVVFNLVVEHLKASDVGFLPSQVKGFGLDLTNTLTDTLWLLDCQRDKFAARAIKLPFSKFVGFNKWKLQKKKEPQMQSDDLKNHIDKLCEILTHPWFQNKKFNSFKSEISSLVQGMNKYLTYLSVQNSTATSRHAKSEPVRALSDNWEIRTIEGDGGHFSENYAKLFTTLSEKDVYSPMSTLDFEPFDKFERRNFYDNLKLPIPIALFVFRHGNNLGNVTFVWRIPEDRRDRDESISAKVIQKTLKEYVPIYATRAMRQDFSKTFSRVVNAKPAVMRLIYRYCTGDSSAPENSAEAAVDRRLVDFLSQCDDTDIVFDMRARNGKVADSKLDPFWEEMGRYLDEVSAVHERRHNDHLYLPFATSVEALRREIANRLPPQTPTPSVSWLRLNFWPSNPHTNVATSYTGRFKVKFAVQQRLLRGQHEDAHYTTYQYQLLKQMAVKVRDHAHMICVDDKAIVPIGEPNNPISTGVRSHNKSLVPVGMKLVASDHDFHIAGAVPSVLFHVDIPEDHRDSFHHGKIHVSVKNKVFEPSSPCRHSAENTGILREIASADCVNLDRPILFLYSDGGPDHRTTYLSVKLAAVALFIALDLDMYISARTGPMQSYANPAERTMSCLNLALQNVALTRDATDPSIELRLKSCTTMKKLRSLGASDPSIKEAYLKSVEPVVTVLQERFSKLRWQDDNVCVHTASTDDSINDLASMLKVLDPNLPENPTTIKKLDRYKNLSTFMEKHTRSRQYSFQIKKCNEESCAYCTMNPIRLPTDVFESLHFLPDPVPGEDGYKPFDEVYGNTTDDSGRPSLAHKPLPTEKDKANRKLMVGDRVRGTVMCCECGKSRVVYAQRRLTRREQDALAQIQDIIVYTCGATLFPDGPHQDTIIVKEGLNCASPIETSYYSGKTQTFPNICFHCGDSDIYEGPEVVAKKETWGIVRPICHSCLNSGKPIVTRSAIKTQTARKRSHQP